MIVGEGQVTLAASTTEVVEFVLDLHRYRLTDRKIGRVGRIERHGDTGTVRFAGRIKGMPGPSGVYPFKITPTGLRFGSPIAGAARWFLDFEGTFECEESHDGTIARHTRRLRSSVRGVGLPSPCCGAGSKLMLLTRWCGSSK